MDLDCKTIPLNVCVDSTVCRVLKHFNEARSVSQRPYPDNCHTKKLSLSAEQVILNLVLCEPGIFSQEVKEDLSHVYHAELQESTICIFLKSSGFTNRRWGWFLPDKTKY